MRRSRGIAAPYLVHHAAGVIAVLHIGRMHNERQVKPSVSTARWRLHPVIFKTEVIRRQGPWRHLDRVEYATLDWVAWFNTQRLLAPLGYLSPAEFEAQSHASVVPQVMQPVA